MNVFDLTKAAKDFGFELSVELIVAHEMVLSIRLGTC